MEPQGVIRRLAAILNVDVVGYSRLMGDDETGTLAALTTHRTAFIDPKIAEHHGRIVKLMGDGALVEFASVVDAVQCAAEIQEGMAVRNAGVSEDRRITFRIGVNLGDVIVEGDDIYGDGVNVAARLEKLAEPGGVCVSASVFEHVEGKLDLAFDDLGEQRVKNMAKAVRVYRISIAEAMSTKTKPVPERLPVSDKPSIAVLPFVNLSRDPEQEYFSDGITEDIITALAVWRSLAVIARNSSFVYKGKAVNVTQVARELGVRYVLEGSVRKSGDRLRVSAQLIEATTGHHMWAERFDRALEDVFVLQDKITQRIAATVAPELERAEFRKSTTKRPESLNAWDCYLRGMSYLHELTSEGNSRAREMFRQAIDLDPTYSDAHTGLAFSHLRDILLECTDDREGSLTKGFEAAHRGVALDDASSFAHQTLGTAYIWADQHDLAIAETERAVELNPNDAHACLALGNRLDLAGKPEAGIEQLEKSLQLNPKDPQIHIYMCFLARAHLNARHYDEAAEWARKAVHRRFDYPHAHYILAVCLGHLDRYSEARAAFDECERLHPGFAEKRAGWQPYPNPDRNDHVREGLRKAGLSK